MGTEPEHMGNMMIFIDGTWMKMGTEPENMGNFMMTFMFNGTCDANSMP